ncbi:MAG: hypothetical protein IJR68_03785 [Fretibacterium sp.]|nr:hypothetical protein [Fretibacterium sp.]
MRDETPGFRFAELLLYGYPRNMARLERARERLETLRAESTCRAQGYEPIDHSGGPGDPVGTRAAEIVSLENEIGLLERRTAPITALMGALETPFVLEGTANAELARVARLFYFGKMGKGAAAAKLKVDRKTFYRMRARLVELTMKYMDLVDMVLKGK